MQIKEIIGNIGENAKSTIKEETLSNGAYQGFLSFSVGVYDRTIKKDSGEKEHLTKWYRVVKILYGDTKEILQERINKYLEFNKLEKGAMVCVRGKDEDRINSYEGKIEIQRTIYLTGRPDTGEYLRVLRLSNGQIEQSSEDSLDDLPF